MTAYEIAKAAVAALDNKKAQNIKVLRVEDVTVLTEYLVIATGTGTTHVKTLADEVEFKLKQQGTPPLRVEGFSSASWIVIDFGGVMVHVFHPEAREFYGLERLWNEGQEVEL